MTGKGSVNVVSHPISTTHILPKNLFLQEFLQDPGMTEVFFIGFNAILSQGLMEIPNRSEYMRINDKAFALLLLLQKM